ncbi:hypothetical protein FACS1894200_08410 [Spirochaetia bacterium]|nr:hypothetical protein FACS1894200_08400 [Spirochaetia bacterium]GHU49600.1 hypothetical protein FACS1894200_08410 [Spirochaetia bacterium]
MTAGNIVSRLGAGQTIEELLADFPYLEREDILQALQYAGCLASGYTEEEEAWLTQGQEVEVSSRRVALAN